MNTTTLQRKYDTIGMFTHMGYARVTIDGKVGLIDKTGYMVSLITFDEIDGFEGGFAIVKNNGKYGLLDAKCSLVVEPKYGSIKLEYAPSGNSYYVNPNDMIAIVESNSLFGIIGAKNGAVKLPIEYTSIKKLYIHNGSGDYFIISKDNKCKLINSSLQYIIDYPVDFIGDFYQNGRFIKLLNDGKVGVFSTNGKTNSHIIYDEIYPLREDYFVTEINKKIGLMNASGNSIIPNIYDGIKYNRYKAVVELNGKYGLIDIKTGEILLDTIYEKIDLHFDGSCIVGKDTYTNKYFFIDNNNNIVIGNKLINNVRANVLQLKNMAVDITNTFGFDEHEHVYFRNETYYIVKNDNRCGVLDFNKYRMLLNCVYTEITPIKLKDDIHIFKIFKDGLYGIYQPSTDKILFESEYDRIFDFDDEGIALVEKDGKFGYIRIKNNKTYRQYDYNITTVCETIVNCEYDGYHHIGFSNHITIMIRDGASVIIDIKATN